MAKKHKIDYEAIAKQVSEDIRSDGYKTITAAMVKEIAKNPTKGISHPVIGHILSLIKCKPKKK